MNVFDRRNAAVVLAAVLVAAPVAATGPYPPYPPYPAPPPPQSSYQSSYQGPYPYPPPRVIDPNPPPLSPMMRAIYAPFYVTGLVLRYGIYYTLVAPFEVFNRAITYGVEGGVERQPPPPPPPPAPAPEPNP
jgi:hypothetical protein